MLSLGMRLPRKSRDKTRTLYACVLGDCLINDVYSCECLRNGVIPCCMCYDCLCS